MTRANPFGSRLHQIILCAIDELHLAGREMVVTSPVRSQPSSMKPAPRRRFGVLMGNARAAGFQFSGGKASPRKFRV